MPTTVLVTVSKSGIGKGLLEAYAVKPNTIAIAAIRDGPDSAAAKELASIDVGKDSKIVVLKYDAGSRSAATEMVSILKSEYGINHLDVVIANAGILKHFGPATEASAETLLEHIQINTIAPILLYQATHALLTASSEPKFFIISSDLGSIGDMKRLPLPMLAYGMSKAAVNYAAVKFHHEDSKITVVPIQPGWVQTNMGQKAADLASVAQVPVTIKDSIDQGQYRSRTVSIKDSIDQGQYRSRTVSIKDSIAGSMKVFDSATKSETSGTFPTFEGAIIPW
jgi:norsolorinic acid ketoreductase